MKTATLQTKVTPMVKAEFTKLAKSRGLNVSAYIDQLVAEELRKAQKAKTLKELKDLIEKYPLTLQEDKELADFYGLQ